MISDKQNFLKWFRDAAPYIREHNGKTFVIQIDGDLIASDLFQGFVHDIALLNTLGIKLVIVFGVRTQVEACLKQRGIESGYHRHLRITDKAALECFKEAVGAVRFEIEARLSMGLPNSPMAHSDITVTSGNYISAKPLGVIDGIDMQFTGEVRNVDSDRIRASIDRGEVVLLSSLGTAKTGEVFNISAHSVATETAIALKADKLIFSFPYDGLRDSEGKRIQQLLTEEAETLQTGTDDTGQTAFTRLGYAVQACKTSVERVHLIDCRDDSSLLIELFSRDGSGTLISRTQFDSIRKANRDDIAGILELIHPLELQGRLVPRSVEQLEQQVDDFTVLEREGAIIACIAAHVHASDRIAEIACVVVHPDYQGQGKGAQLFQRAELELKKNNVQSLFLLTTQANHWFLDHGFTEAAVEDLPLEKQRLYNYQRNSKVLLKHL